MFNVKLETQYSVNTDCLLMLKSPAADATDAPLP
jgi:hypothetical protein